MKRILLAAGLAVLAGATIAQTPPPAAPAAMRPVGMTLSSPDFQDGGIIPDQFTSKVYVGGIKANSPALNWTGAPAGTQSFVLIVHDLDVQLGKGLGDNLHWMAWNIPGTATSLPQSVPTVARLPDGTQQNRWGNNYGWGGPGAPAPIYHHYVFEIWALDSKLDLPEGANRADVQKAMDGHVLDKGFLVGRFHR